MKRKILSLLALVLAFAMLGGTLTACKSTGGDETTDSKEQGSQAVESTDTNVGETNAETTDDGETSDSGEQSSETEGKEVVIDPIVIGPALEGKHGDTIAYANAIADSVQAYYNANRTEYTVVNKQVTINFPLPSAQSQVVGSITNSKGHSYIQNTMDAFVRMSDGKTYYASSSTKSARPNIYKLGYYYYNIHLLDHDFLGDAEISASKDFMARIISDGHDITKPKVTDDVISYTVTGMDPYALSTNSTSNERYYFLAEEFNAIQFSLKVTSAKNGEFYFLAGGRKGHSSEQRVPFTIEADGEWHTYTLTLDKCTDFVGKVTGFRFDIGGSGETVQIKDIKAVKLNSNAPDLVFDRTLHTYPDKINQVLHFVARSEITGIEALGMVTEIAADTVNKLVVKDKNGLHDSLDGVDFASAEYIGFDIKDAGVFGYILLAHENSGKLEVTLSDGVYTIIQTSAPKDGKMIPPNAKTTYTDNDFFMGHRLYTDENHTFDAFLLEAEYERHPMETVSGSKYLGYDALVGAYKFSITGDGFNEPFFTAWNRHHRSDVQVVGGDKDRNIYVYTNYNGGCGEAAAILDENDMLLPIPTMIYKNFGGEDEEPIFNAGDHVYSETFFPLVVKAGETSNLTVLNLYMNWGTVPLKQLSSIQYFWPYYHLSLGTTETSCISPWYGARSLWTLPDFRGLSMPYWFEMEGSAYSNQPQHTHGGFQYFLQYTDADGNYYATENINNNIDASGPVYADVQMDYLSNDGKIKVSYTHLEFPETDELRAYYEIEYEILEELSIKDFKNDFSFYSFEGYSGQYRKMGYLDENNKIVHKDVNRTADKELIVLGNENPYVSMYDLDATGSWKNNNCNLGFVIADSKFVFGGKECNENFVITGSNAKYSLSLNLDELTLKPGDTLKINMIIVPWGWYNSTDDSNMQKVRENTCLDPLTLTVNNGEKIESAYMPKIKSTNGKSAEFTLSGASNNVAVRVYGFNKLTAPKIYEKVDGKWVEYVVCSINNPDKIQNKHYYDGYTVHYDGDGTYSYAFVVNMDNVESRTFKIEVDKDFTPWPVIDKPVSNDPIKVYVDPSELEAAAQSNTGIAKAEMSADKSYTRFHGGSEHPEGFFSAYRNDAGIVTGQYLIVKYRIPASNTENTTFEIFTSTTNTNAVAGESFYYAAAIKDGEWHVMVADLTKQNLPTYATNSDGEYITKHVRFDIFSSKMSADSYVDIAYIGITDSIEEICKINGNKGEAIVTERGAVIGTLDLSNGEFKESGVEEETENDSPNPEVFIDPTSGWTESQVKYKSAVDFINGKGDGDGAHDQRGGNSTNGIDVIVYDGPTVGNANLAIAGWTAVYGGIEKYMWSADDGKTWKECTLYNMEKFSSVGADHPIIKTANNFIGVSGYSVAQHSDKIVYQGNEGKPSGISAQLTDYVGKTVNVIFAAVPATDTDSLCLIAYVKNVRVYASDEEASEAEKVLTACAHKTVDHYVFVDDGDASTDQAKMQGVCKCEEVTFEASVPEYVFFFGKIADQNTAPLVMENKYNYRTFDANAIPVSNTTKSFTADADGKLYMNGWAGVNGGIGDVVFKVFDANGKELTNGWTSTSTEIKLNQSDLNSEMAKRGIETKYGARYTFTLDLAPYFAASEKITVKLALEVSSVPAECNDKYVHMGEFTNVTKAK